MAAQETLTAAEYQALFGKKKSHGNKWKNVKTEVDGLKFDSLKEARRWGDLKLLEKAGVITGLRRQVVFELTVDGKKICKYVADAVYIRDGQQVVEDTKGKQTREYRLKAKMMKAILGITIHEV